ncbi:hypothetical protein [Rhodococcoides corynebacterioides]|uniref:hypothetical protein n=1 Tax=Rhodococcoides corynebacterioides TaxID=53972 RepID=UPI00082B6998|nr:hypothetical protein [Rhodococcus corynebacterioides]
MSAQPEFTSDENDLLLTRRALLRRGVTDAEIRTAKRGGTIVPIRRGCFAETVQITAATPEERHLLLARAALDAASSGLVLSHQSAALAWGFDLWRGAPEIVHLTADRPTGGRVDRMRHVHAHLLDAVDVTERLGLPITTAARTIADLACALPFDEAVCVGDSALRSQLATPELLAAALARCGRRRGTAKARRVLSFLDSRSESVGESRSRVYFDRFDVPAPDLQVEIVVDGKTYRVDFLWDGVVGEFDGLSKYAGDQGGDAVVREKLREDALRAAGYVVIRWTWADLADGRLARRVLAALVGR